jgi:hypothetical protein
VLQKTRTTWSGFFILLPKCLSEAFQKPKVVFRRLPESIGIIAEGMRKPSERLRSLFVSVRRPFEGCKALEMLETWFSGHLQFLFYFRLRGK